MVLVNLVFYSFLAGATGASVVNETFSNHYLQGPLGFFTGFSGVSVGSDSFDNHYLHGPLGFLTGFSEAPTGVVVDYIITARHRGKR